MQLFVNFTVMLLEFQFLCCKSSAAVMLVSNSIASVQICNFMLCRSLHQMATHSHIIVKPVLVQLQVVIINYCPTAS